MPNGWYWADPIQTATTESRLDRIRRILAEAKQWGHRYSFTNEDIEWLVAEIDRLTAPTAEDWE